MGVLDFDRVFSILDSAGKGYVTVEQVHQFDEKLHMSALSQPQLAAAVQQVCGNNHSGQIDLAHFPQVLQDMERRRQLEQHVRWDFMALDKTGDALLPIKDVLMLFQMTHGSDFSMHYWNKFLASREDPLDDVYFDEVCVWLCNIPDQAPASPDDLTTESDRLLQLKKQRTEEEYETLLHLQSQNDVHNREMQEYRESTRRLARQRQLWWQQEGVGAMLRADDMHAADIPTATGSLLGLTDVMDALERKYNILRTKLMWHMLKHYTGEMLWAGTSTEDQEEYFKQLSSDESKLRKDGLLQEKRETLQGAIVTHGAKLDRLMGEFGENMVSTIQDERVMLRGQGKTESDTEKILEQEFINKTKGPTKCGDLLLALHERYQQERNQLLDLLRKENIVITGTKSPAQSLTREYCQLLRQQLLGEDEDDFDAAAAAVGLAEREQDLSSAQRFERDRWRQEYLAQLRLQKQEGVPAQPPEEIPEAARNKNPSILDLQIEAVREITLKHKVEREILGQLLQGPDSASSRTAAAGLGDEGRQARLASLRNQRNAWRENMLGADRAINVTLLQEGVGLCTEEVKLQRQAAGRDTSAVNTNAAILAHLQQRQDQEFSSALALTLTKAEFGLQTLVKQERAARCEQHLDNLAVVILGTVSWTEEELPLIDALKLKYDSLRSLLFQHLLQLQYGGAWFRLNEEEKKKLLSKKLSEEQRLRQDGKYTEMSSLLQHMPETMPSLHHLMGEDRQEYSKRITAREEKFHGDVLLGKPTQMAKSDELPDNTKNSSILTDLARRFTAEQDMLIGWLRSHDKQGSPWQQKQLPVALLRVETRVAKHSDWFDQGALQIGLIERIKAALDGRHTQDMQRQRLLARQCVLSRRKRVSANRPYHREKDDYARPEKGDLLAWMDSLMGEHLKIQREERELLMALLMDPGTEELREAAGMMPHRERRDRLIQLQAKRNTMNLEDPGDQEEHLCVLEEAAAIAAVIRQQQLQKTKPAKSEVDLDEVVISLLVDLQTEQDVGLANIVLRLVNMDEEELKIGRELAITARHQAASDNVLVVLTKYDGSAQDTEMLKALDEKYDALHDRLILDLLMKQTGAAEWNVLSEQERQRKLAQLKLHERQLRRDGKFDELARLLGDNTTNEEVLSKLMGIHRAEYQQKLQERLATHQRRRAQGLEDEEEEGIEEGAGDHGNILDDLQKRYDAEKDALLSRLRGQQEGYLSERERQTELVRLKRERRMVQREDNFTNAALVLGLAERQEADLTDKLKNDRARQQQLAKSRLEQLKSLHAAKKGSNMGVVCGDDKVVKTTDANALQDAVLCHLDYKHQQERHLLAQLMDADADTNTMLLLSACSSSQCSHKLEDLFTRWQQLQPNQSNENRQLLQDGCFFKMSCRAETLGQGQDVEKSDIQLSLMSDLQERQDTEAEDVMKAMLDKNDADLILLQESIIKEKKMDRGQCVSAVIFGREDYGKDVGRHLVKELEGKYDTLRDKLMQEALMKQAGEAEWQKLSEEERQHRLVEMKLKERQLRKEGRLDEAAHIMGEAVLQRDKMESFLGVSRKEHELRLKERLKKRKQRLAEGFSEEEIDAMEKEEYEVEKKKQNILLDLDRCFEQEKEELLRRLRHYNSKTEAEQQRQRELARLRLEQRRVQREEKFDAAALYMGMAKQQEAALDERRNRQEKLAKERLSIHLKERKEKRKKAGPVPSPMDSGDLVGWQEAVCKEMEGKHAEEREKLVEVMRSSEVAAHRLMSAQLSADVRSIRRVELQAQHHMWRHHVNRDGKLQQQIFQDGLALRMEELKTEKQATIKDSCDEELMVALLANLQDVQDNENQRMLAGWEQMNVDTLKQLKVAQEKFREDEWWDNIATVLFADPSFSPTLVPSDDQVVAALKNKYDALRDKVLLEALMTQSGAANWGRLPEASRQSQLLQLKLEEQRLEKAGHHSEAAALLEQLQLQHQVLRQQLGESAAAQHRAAAERGHRRDQLQRERAAAGLTTEPLLLDVLLDQQDQERGEPTPPRSIFEELSHHHEAERDALLTRLHGHDAGKDGEKDVSRAWQVAVAELRWQKQLVEGEESFDTSTAMLTLWQQYGGASYASITSQRERQTELARKRLAATQQKQSTIKGSEAELQNQEEFNYTQDALDLARSQIEGLVVVLETVLQSVDTKQKQERQILADILRVASADTDANTLLNKLQDEEYRLHLEKLRQEHTRWRQRGRGQAIAYTDNELSAEDRERHIFNVAQAHTEQFSMLVKAAALQVEIEKHEGGQEGVGVVLMVQLQLRQQAEVHALIKAMATQNEAGLRKLKSTQQMAVREGWVDNVANVVFGVVTDKYNDEDDDLKDSQEKLSKVDTALEQEFETERKNLTKKLTEGLEPGEGADISAQLAALEAQQQQKQRVLHEAMIRQQEQTKARLLARRQVREERELENDAAVRLVHMSDRQQSFLHDKNEKDRARVRSVMQERIAARRDSRRNKINTSGTLSGASHRPTSSRPGSMDSNILPGGMHREKTVLDVDLSDAQKQEVYMQLARQQVALNRRMESDQKRQEEQLKRRLQDMKEKREDEVVGLLRKAESQKSTLEKQKQSEKDRQVAATKERVARLRHEKTRTVKDQGDPNARQFEQLVMDGGSSAMSEEERMQLAAQHMQDQFKAEEQQAKKSVHFGGEGAGQPLQLSNKKERLGQLKARREAKKKQRNLHAASHKETSG